MESREEVVEGIRAIRTSEIGLSEETLGNYRSVMGILGTDDPSEAVERLSACVQRLIESGTSSDRNDARALKAALGIDLPLLKNVTARRTKARQAQLYIGKERSQYYAEDRAIDKLVRILFEEADQQDNSSCQSRSLDGADSASVLPASPSETPDEVTFPQAFNVFRRALRRRPLFPRFAHTFNSPDEEWWTGIVVGVFVAFLIGALILYLTGVLS